MKTDKYKGKNVTELQSIAKSRDSKIEKQKGEIEELEVKTDYLTSLLAQLPEIAKKGRVVRMGTALSVSTALGALKTLKPGLKKIGGTPISVDHLAVLLGLGGAYLLGEDPATAGTVWPDVAEGVATPGIVSIGERTGARIAA